MAVTELLGILALLAGIFSIALFVFTLYFERDKKKSKILLIWAVLFLAAAFAAIEYALWLEGFYLFDIISKFIFPLLSYFVVWFAFIVWLFESRKERKIWILLAVALLVLIAVALNCPNCIRI